MDAHPPGSKKRRDNRDRLVWIKGKTYTLPARKELSIKPESARIIFKFLERFDKYHEYRTLSFVTKEGKKLKIKSRFYKNFEELNVAIRKASY